MSRDSAPAGADILPAGLEPFNGYRKHHSALIPISLIAIPSKLLSWLDKVMYGQLRFDAGNSDRCRVKIGGIAARMGISEDSVQRSIDQLHKVKLVFRKRVQHGLLIVFLKSHLLDGSTPKENPSDTAILRDEGGHPDTATVRDMNGVPDTATLRLQENPDTATLRNEIPQPCGSDTATLRHVLRKEGFSLGIKRNKPEAQLVGWPSSEEFDAAWRRHMKYRGRGEHLQRVIAILIGKSHPPDWSRFYEVHPKYCAYWLRKGWDFCPLTLLEWIEAGMPEPPPEPTSGTRTARNANDDWAEEQDRRAREEAEREEQ